MIFVSSNAAVAAATCFEPGIDPTRYGYIAGRDGSGVLSKGRFTSVVLHPSFNPYTFSNNIAVVTFTLLPDDATRTISVALTPLKWAQRVHTKKGMVNANTWKTTEYLNSVFADQAACSAASGLFAANQGDFMCSQYMLQSEYTQGCRLPYQHIVNTDGDKTVEAALYSHSSVAGDQQYCTTEPIYNYYINVANYIPWITSKIKSAVDAVSLPNGPAAPIDIGYRMVEPTVQSSANRRIYSIFHGGRVYLPREVINIVFGDQSQTLGGPMRSARSMIFVETKTATSTVIETKEASTSTTSTTSTETTTSTSSSTVTTTATLSHTDTSTTTLSTTFTTTVTQTSFAMVTNVAMVTTTTDATTSSTTTLTLTSNAAGLPVCPIITPCPPAGPGAGSTTVTRTSTTTSTLTLASYNFAISNQIQTAPGAPGPILATITFTTTQKADTTTSTVTVPAASHPATTTTTTVRELVSSTTTLPAKTSTHHLMSTIVSTSVRVESAPEKPTPPAQPWAIAMTIIIALLVVAVVSVLLFSCLRRRRKRYQPDSVTQYNGPPSAYPPEYYSQPAKGYAQTSYTNDERQSRYNSHGSYVGYL